MRRSLTLVVLLLVTLGASLTACGSSSSGSDGNSETVLVTTKAVPDKAELDASNTRFESRPESDFKDGFPVKEDKWGGSRTWVATHDLKAGVVVTYTDAACSKPHNKQC